MGVRLTSSQLLRLTDVIRDISSPLTSTDVDEWRLRVTTSFKALLNADKAVLAVAGLDSAAFFSSELGDSPMSDYASHYFENDPGVARMKEIPGPQYSRSLLWGSLPGVFEATEVYNDWYEPLGLLDGCGIKLYEDLQASAAGNSPTKLPTVVLGAYRDRKGSEPFNTWGPSVMQLLAPALEAAVITRRALGQFQNDLTSVIDGLPSAIVAYDVSGHVLHRNTALQTLLENEPGRDTIMRATRELALRLVRQTTPASGDRAAELEPLSVSLRPNRRRYSLHAARLPGALFSLRPPVAVLVKRAERTGHSASSLWRDRFGFTHREMQVATLLLNRYSTDEIACALCMSPHTARHHVERVYQKAGVSGRTALRSRLG
jgi:DNA-binding CsgD family transcriptional regulator